MIICHLKIRLFITAIITVLAALSYSPAQAERITLFAVSPLVTSHYGETEYELVFDFDNGLGSTDQVRSLLEYPLDYVAAGVGIGITILSDGKREWQLDLKLQKNLSNPRGLMKDHDWFRIVGVFDGKVSFTESVSDISAATIDFELQRTITSGQKIDLSWLFGLSYQRFEQTMIGFKGWQIIDSTLQQQNISGTDSALFYRVTWVVPQAGFVSGYRFSKLFGIEGKFAVSMPLFYDKDKHLLRNFETESNGLGFGISSRLKARYDFVNGGTIKFLELSGEIMTIGGNTNEKQTYYGDDPGTPNIDETGLIIEGIPHEVRSIQYGIGLNIGFAF